MVMMAQCSVALYLKNRLNILKIDLLSQKIDLTSQKIEIILKKLSQTIEIIIAKI